MYNINTSKLGNLQTTNLPLTSLLITYKLDVLTYYLVDKHAIKEAYGTYL